MVGAKKRVHSTVLCDVHPDTCKVRSSVWTLQSEPCDRQDADVSLQALQRCGALHPLQQAGVPSLQTKINGSYDLQMVVFLVPLGCG